MSEYLRILKQNKDQLENSIYTLSNGKLISPSINKEDIRKIAKSSKK